MTSASCSARRPCRVMSPALPGPAPTSTTCPCGMDAGSSSALAVSSSARSVRPARSEAATGPVSIHERNLRRAPISANLCPDALTPAIGECGQRAQRSIQQCLEPLADQPREHRRSAAGRDGDLHRRAVDDGGHDEAGKLAVVDHVAGNARGIRGGGDRGVDRAIVGGSHHQPLAVDIGHFEYPRDMRHRATAHGLGELGTELRRHDGDHGAGLA